MKSYFPADTGLTNEDFEVLLGIFSPHVELQEVILFGSRALGTFKKGSDIDIALICSDAQVIKEVSVQLNQLSPLPYKFDVLDYMGLTDASVKEHIDKFGKIIFSR